MSTSEIKPITPDEVVFTEATPHQRELSWRINSISWSHPLSLEDHLERGALLGPRGPERTFYVVHRRGDPEDIICAVDAVGKTALVKAPDAESPTSVQRVKAYGVAAVHTNPTYRKQGMAGWMLQKLQEAMDKDSEFSVLYSGIGPDFYARYGWDAFPALQVSLSFLGGEAAAQPTMPAGVKFLSREDIAPLCDKDIAKLTARFEEFPGDDGRTRVAFLPTFKQIDWQFERNAFVARKLRHREPENYGAVTADGSSWIYWVHEVGKDTLGVLRIVANGPAAVADLLRAALVEAKDWGFERVVVWNPEGDVEDAVRTMGTEDEKVVKIRFEAREGRLPCLRWKGGDHVDVVWEDNYYYAWC